MVRAAQPRDGRYTIMDSKIRGFGLRVYPSGQKTWIFEYKGGGGGRGAPTKRVTIGKAAVRQDGTASSRGASVLTPDQARAKAKTLSATVQLGEDPQQEKMDERAAESISDLIPDFLSKHVMSKRKPGTLRQYEDVLNRIVVPATGKKKARDILRADISKLHLKWKHTPYHANRMLAIVGSMYS